MADQLDQLPQFFQTQSAQRGGGALFGGAGRSVIDLRAMGPQRTLVLLDGARLAPADRDGSVHVDNIPTALLSQVEVVTGGASAAYGADALAGVTNFRLNRTYDGMDFRRASAQPPTAWATTAASRSRTAPRSASVGTSSRSARVSEHRSDRYDPLELGDWFQRYGIVANPAWTTGNTSVPHAARAARRLFAQSHADGQDRRCAQRPPTAPPPPDRRFRSPGQRSRTTAPPCGRSRRQRHRRGDGQPIRRHGGHRRHDRAIAQPRVQRRAVWRRGRAQQRVLRLHVRRERQHAVTS